MGLFDSDPTSTKTSSSDTSSSYTATPPSDHLDTLLAGAGYTVRSSELTQVAQRLVQLEAVMVNAPNSYSHQLNDAVLHNPAELSCWVDSLLTEFNQPVSDLQYAVNPTNNTVTALNTVTQQQQLVNVVTALEEDSSIRLVHVLLSCAESVQRGDFLLAGTLLEELQILLSRVNSNFGFGKVAGYFNDALSRLIFQPSQRFSDSGLENEILYHHFYEACPYLTFAHFTANQAILEAFDGHDCVHIIDFNLMQGLQWPAIIQALALRPNGPPILRLTGIGPPSPEGQDRLRETGLKLAELAQSVNVRFAFRGVAASRIDDVKPWMLQVDPKEAVAVNSIMQLHKLLDDPIRMSSVLKWIHSLNPKIITVAEQDTDHNQAEFMDRFRQALFYYSTMLDSLEACNKGEQQNSLAAEIYIQRQICNVVCGVERHEHLAKWKERMNLSGFAPLYLSSNAYKQASMLLRLNSTQQGYCVDENEGCLTLGWHSSPLLSVSAWRPITQL